MKNRIPKFSSFINEAATPSKRIANPSDFYEVDADTIDDILLKIVSLNKNSDIGIHNNDRLKVYISKSVSNKKIINDIKPYYDIVDTPQKADVIMVNKKITWYHWCVAVVCATSKGIKNGAIALISKGYDSINRDGVDKIRSIGSIDGVDMNNINIESFYMNNDISWAQFNPVLASAESDYNKNNGTSYKFVPYKVYMYTSDLSKDEFMGAKNNAILISTNEMKSVIQTRSLSSGMPDGDMSFQAIYDMVLSDDKTNIDLLSQIINGVGIDVNGIQAILAAVYVLHITKGKSDNDDIVTDIIRKSDIRLKRYSNQNVCLDNMKSYLDMIGDKSTFMELVLSEVKNLLK